MKIELFNIAPGQKLKDTFSDEEFVTEDGIAFFANGAPIAPKNAIREGFVLSRDFIKPSFKSRGEITDYIQKTLRVPRGQICISSSIKN